MNYVLPIFQKITQAIQSFSRYLLGKRSEIKDLEVKDALLAKTVLDIHRLRDSTESKFLPLFSIKPIHAIDREGAIDSVKKRVDVLQEAKAELLQHKRLSRKKLMEHIPSVSGFKAVQINEKEWVAYEGNGRLASLQEVFTDGDELQIEVEEYLFRNPKKIIRRIQRVRKMNGLV